MKGNPAIIDSLNKQLTLELTSMDQYLAHNTSNWRTNMMKSWVMPNAL